LHERPAVAACAFCAIVGAASLIALLQYLANHGSDRLLISHRHRRDHRSARVRRRAAEPNKSTDGSRYRVDSPDNRYRLTRESVTIQKS
jgi:hypothetical protein